MKQKNFLIFLFLLIFLNKIYAIGPYTDNGDGTVTDTTTGLMWQKSYNKEKKNWKDALAYCENLTLAGFDDWRLPNIQELRSIVKYDSSLPSIDNSIFECDSEPYWSSTTCIFDNSLSWTIDFDNSYKFTTNKSFSDFLISVRCVRGKSKMISDTGQTNCYNNSEKIPCPSEGEDFYGQDANYQGLKQNFQKKEINGDEVVEDLNTELTWQKSDDGMKRNWQEAKDYCENLHLAGYDNWRLPTIFELSTIITYDKYHPTIDTNAFESKSEIYWSSTSITYNYATAWSIYFEDGNDNWNSKSNTYYVRCVRSGLSDNSDNCDSNHLGNCKTENDCAGVGGYWWSDGTCHNEAECTVNNLSACNTQSKCESIGKYWYGNKCNTEPQQTGDPCSYPTGIPVLKPVDSCKFKDKYDVGEEITFELKYSTGFQVTNLPIEKDNCKISNDNVLMFNPVLQKLSFIGNGLAEITCVYNNKVTREQFIVGNFINEPRNAIIVVGKGKEGDSLEPTFKYLGNLVYTFLKSQSYSDDDIVYLNSFDNSSGFADKTDFTEDDIFNYIKSSPKSSVPLLIYIIDHGSPAGSIFLNGSFNQLSAASLKTTLDQYQSETSRKVIVVVDSCYSGKFVDILKASNRVVISSSQAKEKALMTTGGISFTNYFIKNLQDKLSIGESFNKAKLKYNLIVKNTNPDIGGDSSIYNKPFGFLYSASGDVMENFTGKQSLKIPSPTEYDVVLTAKNIIGISDSEAYAIVTPPQVIQDEGDNVILAKSDKVKLDYNSATGKFSGNYNFSKEGKYIVQYEVTDGAGDKYTSDSVEIQVGESSAGVVIENNNTTVSLSINSGWNLKALPVKVNNGVAPANIFNSENISTIWKWTGSSWQIWSPDSNISNLIGNYGLATILNISSGEGLWINAKAEVSVKITGGSEGYGVEELSVNTGWNLLGVGKNITTLALNTLGNISTVWKWGKNNWQIWSPKASIMNLINNYGLSTIGSIGKGEGFWVNK